MSESKPDGKSQNTDTEHADSGDGPAADGRITDDMLPEDLRPTDDNPLAKPLTDEDEEGGMSLEPDGPQA